MVRGKVEMKRIENATSRQVSFSKRRVGLRKKAYELSVLCDVEVALIIFSQKGKLYEFSSSNIRQIIQRYHERSKEARSNNNNDSGQYREHLKHETILMEKKIELLEVSQRKLLGQGLESCSMRELNEIDCQLEKSLKHIRTRKAQVYKEQIESLKAKHIHLLQENAILLDKVTFFSLTLQIEILNSQRLIIITKKSDPKMDDFFFFWSQLESLVLWIPSCVELKIFLIKC
ncbi:PREDICTED: MADS-box protein AGL42-like isoform X1 [Ipomoea nil]|uniref:MADS-box protein AGL42-like isoform X1 n=1 Tax=Ipomoea nil TaxID=35883 RepID=UPI000900B541|nr:PREDICTED: MADS-box protein AGL42-like isoform X1 [Ipomoea nil]XP_019192451.1 PREDICTED: MADS-box protein AGL42-like isoform X1 [Ipomoea nil]XP_019192453.1 PREDICTED: MADS-box protein AGL42-like isoform X1 [Ipomoea nil]